MLDSLYAAILIFGLRCVDVSLGTVRVILTIQGRRTIAALIGFVEVSIFVTAVATVVSGPLDVFRVLGYGLGFAAGTYLGMTIDRRLALGDVVLRAITTSFEALTSALTDAGFGVTLVQGRGGRGSAVGVIFSVCHRRQLPEMVRLVCQVDPNATITVEEVRQRLHGHFPPKRPRALSELIRPTLR